MERIAARERNKEAKEGRSSMNLLMRPTAFVTLEGHLQVQ